MHTASSSSLRISRALAQPIVKPRPHLARPLLSSRSSTEAEQRLLHTATSLVEERRQREDLQRVSPSLLRKSQSSKELADSSAKMDAPVFPPDFLKGVALSVFQNSSDRKSNWTDFIKRKGYLGQPENKDAFAHAADFWNMYETDIKMAKEALGATSFRFSFEWARFEPDAAGQWDEAAFERYDQIIDCIRAHGLEPMATLHHFVHPSWFEAQGGFTKEENLHYFVTYATKVFERFHKKIKLWSTFNEPTCFAFVGYIVSLWAPGHLMKLQLAGTVLGNLLKAHCSAYRALKQLPGGKEACVGMVHQHIAFYPRHNLPWVRSLAKWMTFWFGTHSVMTFFTTGRFEWDSPFQCGGPKVLWVDEGVAKGEKVTDWWGINYYSRPCIHWNFQMGPSEANEPCTDINFRLYPQGLYDSIKDASVLKVPIYITEIGLADKADKNRGKYIQDIYAMLLKSIADGYDVRGAYWWTLMDNIEWHDGFHIKFGLYQWDPEYATDYKDTNYRPPEGLRLREGSKQLPLVYNAWPTALEDVRKYGNAQQHAQQQQATGAIASKAAAAAGADAVSHNQISLVASSAGAASDAERAPLVGTAVATAPAAAALPSQ